MSRDAAQWLDEIALREASLADARREWHAGELSARALGDIERRERAALRSAEASLAALAPVRPPQPARRARVRHARWLLVAGLCFALALGVLLWSALTPRQAGTSATGSIALGSAQRIQQLLGEAEADIANGQPVTALEAYREVLRLDPTNVAALTQTGWLDFSAGSAGHNASLVSVGVGDLRRALDRAPRDPAARLYYAIVAASTPGEGALARRAFRLFVSLGPSPAQLAIAEPFLVQLGLRPG